MQKIMAQMVSDVVQKGGYYSSPNFVGIQDLFANGTFLSSPLSSVNGFDLKVYFQKILYAILAVKAWHLTENLYPVVM